MATTRCDLDGNKCRSQIALNRLLRDPVLGPFLKSKAIDKSSGVQLSGYGWISLPTTPANGTNESKEKLNSKNDIINFFAIKRFSPEESKDIYNALTESMASGKGTGRNIIFDSHGNFAFWDGNTNKILRNPIIPPNNRKSDGQLNAKDGADLFTTHNKFMVGTNIYYYNNRMIANPKMTYFILTKDVVPSENSIYYLVYNPIHRKKFQEYYTHLLGYEGVWRGNKLVKTIGNRGYQNKPINTVPSVSGGQGLVAPSFINIAARYCNAIKIGGDTLANGKPGEHYADPTCNFILSEDDANLALITGKNHTQSNMAYEKYAPINGTVADAKVSFLNSRRVLLNGPGNSQLHWPCKDSHPKDQQTSLSFAENSGLLFENSTSFVNVLGNAYINNFGTTLTSQNNALNVGGENFNRQPGCTARSLNITSCTNVIEIGGDARGNDFAMQNACGMQRPEPEPVTPVTPGGGTVNIGGDPFKPKPTTRPSVSDDDSSEATDNNTLYIIIAVLLTIITGLFLFL